MIDIHTIQELKAFCSISLLFRNHHLNEDLPITVLEVLRHPLLMCYCVWCACKKSALVHEASVLIRLWSNERSEERRVGERV